MKETEIKGKLVDNETRCVHYQTEKDIVAIKFYCCDSYFPCFKCHEETVSHDIQLWPMNKWNEFAVLCGSCKTELTINQYLTSNSSCPSCGSAFNDKCSLHHHLYFQV
nr:CHY zinc finger protein [Alkalihalobacillus sp. CinArs1]